MSVAFSQSSQTQIAAAGTAISARLANTNTNALVVGGTWGLGSAANVAVTDTAGNSWVTAYTDSDAGNIQSVGLWYALNIATASVNTVTLTTPSADFRALTIHEYSGVKTTTASDGTKEVQASVTNVSAGTVTTTVGGDLLFGWAVNTGGANLLTATNSATTRERSTAGVIFSSADSVQAAAGAGNITWTMPAADTSIAGMLALKAALVNASDDVVLRMGAITSLVAGSFLVTGAFAATSGAVVLGGGAYFKRRRMSDGMCTIEDF